MMLKLANDWLTKASIEFNKLPTTTIEASNDNGRRHNCRPPSHEISIEFNGQIRI